MRAQRRSETAYLARSVSPIYACVNVLYARTYMSLHACTCTPTGYSSYVSIDREFVSGMAIFLDARCLNQGSAKKLMT